MFERHELIEEKDGYLLILYIQVEKTEFADELGDLNKRNTRLLKAKIKRYIREKLPDDIRVKQAKIVYGTIMIGTIPLEE